MLTGLGFAIGVGAFAAIATSQWTLGALLWGLNRIADGLDGAVARNSDVGPTDLGGFLDILADFAIYGGVIVAVGYAVPGARVAALVTFLAYYLNGTAFLAWSSLATRIQFETGNAEGDGRSLVFPTGLAEGAETIIAYFVLLIFHQWATQILWIWAAIVSITIVQRIAFVRSRLA